MKTQSTPPILSYNQATRKIEGHDRGAFPIAVCASESSEKYMLPIVRACNNHERLVEALRGLMDAIGHIKTPATNDGLNLCDAKAKARAILKEINE